MLLSNLEDLINTHNSNWLHPLVQLSDTKLRTGCYLPAGAIIDAPAAIKIPSLSRVTGSPSSALLKLGNPPSKWAAIGTVIDDSAPPESCPTNGDPVIDSAVLVVGINYGQQSAANDYTTLRGASPNGAMPLTVFDSTGLRGKLNTVLTNLKIKLPASFALIATNYFPWITSGSWCSICSNSIAEAWLLKQFGYDDPDLPIIHLIRALSGKRPTLDAVVFHGANCAVPVLALETIKKIPPPHSSIPMIFCDNLAGGGTPSNYLLI